MGRHFSRLDPHKQKYVNLFFRSIVNSKLSSCPFMKMNIVYMILLMLNNKL